MRNALLQLLQAFERIESLHIEVCDTDVREHVHEAIHRLFIAPERGYSLPDAFQMFSDAGDQMVREALQAFLTHPEVRRAANSLRTPIERHNAFQDGSVVTTNGNSFDVYFGYSEDLPNYDPPPTS